MKKKSNFLMLFLIVFIVACSKNTDQANPNNEPPVVTPPLVEQPIRIIQKIARFKVDNNTIIADTTAYNYDDKGRLKSITSLELGLNVASCEYEGDNLRWLIVYIFNDNAIVSQRNHEVTMQGDSAKLLMLSENASGTPDSIQHTYIFSNNIIQSVVRDEHSKYGSSTQYHSYLYNSDGNLTEEKWIGGSPAETSIKILSWDDKINPVRQFSKSGFIAQFFDIPFDSQSLNNQVNYIGTDGKEVALEYTYNKDGYPLTVKRRGEDFNFIELVYSK